MANGKHQSFLHKFKIGLAMILMIKPEYQAENVTIDIAARFGLTKK